MIRSKTVAGYNLLTFGYAEPLTTFPIFESAKVLPTMIRVKFSVLSMYCS